MTPHYYLNPVPWGATSTSSRKAGMSVATRHLRVQPQAFAFRGRQTWARQNTMSTFDNRSHVNGGRDRDRSPGRSTRAAVSSDGVGTELERSTAVSALIHDVRWWCVATAHHRAHLMATRRYGHLDLLEQERGGTSSADHERPEGPKNAFSPERWVGFSPTAWEEIEGNPKAEIGSRPLPGRAAPSAGQGATAGDERQARTRKGRAAQPRSAREAAWRGRERLRKPQLSSRLIAGG